MTKKLFKPERPTSRKRRLVITWKQSSGLGEIESLRCNSFEAANRILRKRDRTNILFASFEGRKTTTEKNKKRNKTQCGLF